MKPKRSKLAKSRADVASRYWRTKADALWSELVRKGGNCQICGATANLQAHHIVDRSVKELRHDTENGVCLCPAHHKYDRALSAHMGHLRFYRWLFRTSPWRTKLLALQVDDLEAAAILRRAAGTKAPKPNYKAEYVRLITKKGGG